MGFHVCEYHWGWPVLECNRGCLYEGTIGACTRVPLGSEREYNWDLYEGTFGDLLLGRHSHHCSPACAGAPISMDSSCHCSTTALSSPVPANATFSQLMRIPLDRHKMSTTALTKTQNVDNYIDDVLVHGHSWEDHGKNICVLCAPFSSALKKQAYLVLMSHRAFIANLSSTSDRARKTATRQQLIEKIATSKLPVTVKKLLFFLGLRGYHRQIVRHYADTSTTNKKRPTTSNCLVRRGYDRVQKNKLKSLLCNV